MGLPMDDDYLYETFRVRKPDNYDELKAQKEAERAAMRDRFDAPHDDAHDDDDGDKKDGPDTVRKPVKNHLRGFSDSPRRTGHAHPADRRHILS